MCLLSEYVSTQFLLYPDIWAMDLFYHSYTLAVARKIEMSSRGFCVPVHVAAKLRESFTETSACLANILRATPVNLAGDAIHDIPGVAVCLSVQVHLVAGSSGLESFASLYVWAG